MANPPGSTRFGKAAGSCGFPHPPVPPSLTSLEIRCLCLFAGWAGKVRMESFGRNLPVSGFLW